VFAWSWFLVGERRGSALPLILYDKNKVAAAARGELQSQFARHGERKPTGSDAAESKLSLYLSAGRLAMAGDDLHADFFMRAKTFSPDSPESTIP